MTSLTSLWFRLEESRHDPRQATRTCRTITKTLLTVLICISAAHTQQAASIQGTVRDAAGNPISGASVRVEKSGTSAAETTSNPDGSFVFSSLNPGEYRLTAESAGRRSASATVHPGQPESQHADLVLGEPNSSSPGTTVFSSPDSAMEFADQPNFTIAAVTDWTAAGGHGSDAVLRTSEALNREALHLTPAPAAGHLDSSTNEWKHTETALRAALARAPGNFDANHQLGAFYLQSEKYGDALPPLEAARKIDPRNFENEYQLALALKGHGDIAQARDHVRQLLLHRDSSEGHRLAGELDEKAGDPLSAVHEFERAARLDPSERNYFEWGSELLLHRAVWQAKDVFSAGVKAWPNSESMLTALGAALFAGALYDEAAQRLCEASDLNPADPEPYTFLGKLEVSSPNPLPCVEPKLARFVALLPDDPLANYFYAMTLWKQPGQSADKATLARVENLLIHAVSSDPKCSEAYLQLGVLQATRRDYPKAIEFYTRAIQANPQLSEAHYRLGVAYDRVGDKGKAAEQFRLHDEIEKQQAAEVEKQRREVKQFVVVVDGKQPVPTTQ